MLYLSFTRSIFDYGDTVWNCCGVGNARLLDNFQRRAFRIVSRSTDSDKALMDLKWPELQSRRDERTFKLVNKCISGNCPQFFKQYFNFNNTRTRQRNLLHLPRV